MEKRHTSIYYLTERYIRKMYKDIVLNELITFVFYFVFNILFRQHPKYSSIRLWLGLVFMLLAVGLLILGKKRADQVASIHYECQEKGLVYYDGGKEHFYHWTDILEIRKNPNRISLIFPYEFHTRQGIWTLHKQVEDSDQLIQEISSRTGIKVDLYEHE